MHPAFHRAPVKSPALRSRSGVLALGAVLAVGGAGALYAGCSGEGSNATDATGTQGTGGSGASSTSTSASGTGGSGASGGSSGDGGAGVGGAAGGGAGVGGGEGGGGSAPWPTCDAPPDQVPEKTLNQIWQDDPAAPTAVWVPGVFVTAISGGACVAGQACQIFVQQNESFADLAGGSQQALKIFVSASAAQHFTAVQVDDEVDVYAHAWRYNVGGQNELLLQVSNGLRGCAKPVGIGAPQPVTVSLSDLTVEAYELTVGPLFIRLDAVSGTPALPAETFGLYYTAGPIDQDAGIETVTSLSPYFLPGSVFTGLNQGVKTDFESVAGVFGLFIPTATPGQKYEEIYPRSEAEYPTVP
jgi:hypothetical protein